MNILFFIYFVGMILVLIYLFFTSEHIKPCPKEDWDLLRNSSERVVLISAWICLVGRYWPMISTIWVC